MIWFERWEGKVQNFPIPFERPALKFVERCWKMNFQHIRKIGISYSQPVWKFENVIFQLFGKFEKMIWFERWEGKVQTFPIPVERPSFNSVERCGKVTFLHLSDDLKDVISPSESEKNQKKLQGNSKIPAQNWWRDVDINIPHTRTHKVLSRKEIHSFFLRSHVIWSYVNIKIKEMQVVLLLKTIAKQTFRDWIKILSENFFTPYRETK